MEGSVMLQQGTIDRLWKGELMLQQDTIGRLWKGV